MCGPKNLLKTWAKFKPVTRHHSWQRGMSDFDMYIAIIMFYCWSSMIMSSYFNVFAPKNYKDLCWYRPKPHFARGVSKLLEGSVFIYLFILQCDQFIILLCVFFDNNLKVKFLVILLFFSFFISLSSRSFARAVSLWVDLVCIRHFSLSAVLCLILTHWEPCQPKQETYYCYCTLSLTHTHTHTHTRSLPQ